MTKEDDINELLEFVKHEYYHHYGTSMADTAGKKVVTLKNLIAENENLKHDLDKYIKRDAEYLSEIEKLTGKLK